MVRLVLFPTRMNHRRTILAALAPLCALALPGCVGKHLVDPGRLRSTPFDLEALSGDYSNDGFNPDGAPAGSLATHLFGDSVRGMGIDRVRFKPDVQGNSLRCLALADGDIVASRTFTPGHDLELIDDAAKFDSRLGSFSADQPGAFHFGVSREGRTLRLSRNGDAVLRFREAGLIVLIIPPLPIPALGEVDVVFPRMD